MDNNGINNIQNNVNPNMEPVQSMDQNMNQPLPQQPMDPNIGPGPNSMEPMQPINPNVGPAPSMEPVQPMPNMEYQQMNPNMEYQQVNPNMQMNSNIAQAPQGEVPVINIEQTPTDLFGQQVNPQPANDPTQMNQMLQSINQPQEEVSNYGYTSNEKKPDLNEDSNASIKFIIVLAILVFAFIMALPYLSSLLDK